MVGVKEIKSRIAGVQDTRKITNAMYLIASNKLQKAKNQLDRTRPYFDALHSEIKRVFRNVEGVENRYFYPADGGEAPDGTYGVLVITADKGLAGGYNQGVIKKVQQLMSEHSDIKLFVVGEWGRRFFKLHNIPVEKSFLYTAQNPTMNRSREISELLLELFHKGELDKIFVVYTDLINNMSTDVVCTRLLPFRRQSTTKDHDGKSTEKEVDNPFEFYPSMDLVIDNVVKSWLSGFIYSALVASFCSEHNARMAAMSTADQNAEKILEALTVEYNRVRQATITQEITEVISGVKAQKRKRKKEV